MQTPTTRYSWRDYGVRQSLYIDDADLADQHLANFSGPVGLDIEWKPNFRKGELENPVALLQLANAGTILLLHICHMSRFPRNLRIFLEDSSIAKAGVGIQGDAQKLYKDCSISLRNCIDLSLLARSVDNAQWKGKYKDPLGLARLIGHYENKLLPKGKITRSNWEQRLDLAQKEYASNDALAGYTLYIRLTQMLNTLPKAPSTRCYTFDYVRGRLCEPSGMSWAPFNPDYDPGPPPPPPPPKATATTSETSSAETPGSKTPRKRPLVSDSAAVGQPRSNSVRDKPKRPKRHHPRKNNNTTA
ncbi:ribonuclease H-like domain-containing protein [Roridomyces roridus]|uniref:3'-5' exonuclease n=1 Tax=Roridomyces roridus TaxID=1738132 RepID=A0AAD7FPE1_9AGAR|nr:ribonuclease H-like domain-containing protein [Roridomyces roridus]